MTVIITFPTGEYGIYGIQFPTNPNSFDFWEGEMDDKHFRLPLHELECI